MIFHDIKKILVIKLRHIGDVILTIPVFRALRENFPDAFICALVNSGTEEVLTGNPLIDRITVFDRNIKTKILIRKIRGELSFLRKIRAEGFDMTVDLTSGDRAAIISFISRANYRIAYNPGKGFWGKRHIYTHLAKSKGDQHAVMKNLDAVRQFGIDTSNLSIDIFIPEKERQSVKEALRENGIKEGDVVAHVHPTSRWLFKCWRADYFAEVIKWMIHRRIKVVVTASPDINEMEEAKRILSLAPRTNLLDLCGRTTIKALAAVSEASNFFLGVDTAPMHIAAAVGTPVIALFGAGEKNWRPWGEGHIVISKEKGKRNGGMSREEYVSKNLAEIKPEEVIMAIRDKLSKYSLIK
ncbi:MAG: putative lipopolysaccharide heptosyltransferase III [Nitrospirota bacterium]